MALGLMVISALAEVISLGAIFPFLGILISPEKVFQQPVVGEVSRFLDISSPAGLVLPLTIAFSAAALAAGAVRMLVLWFTTRLAFASGLDLSLDMYRRTLYQPYDIHIARNSSDVIAGITGKAGNVIGGGLYPSLMFLSSLFVLIAVLVTLISIDPIVATLSAVGFGASYSVVTWISRRRLVSYSNTVSIELTMLIKTLQEGLGGIRDVLLDGTQPLYSEFYRKADTALRRAQGSIAIISSSPRFAMEAIGMTLIAFVAYGLSLRPEGIAVGLPLLGVLALGAQRLIPTLQQMYGSWASIAGSSASLSDALELLDQPIPRGANSEAPEPLRFRDSIALESVRFRYKEDGPWILDGVSFSIRKGSRVGLIGATGSGKSTTMDLLMGLLRPTEGRILVDGKAVTEASVRSWQRNIAHVPQSVFLADATVAENIAFGIPRNRIEPSRVREAARKAQIADFVEREPAGYDLLVGERGVRLSGGQRQRIGIARALYKNATVLVLDEATNSLDSETESAVIGSIEALDKDMTILIIAHRMSTLAHCDQIIQLSHGRTASGENKDSDLKQITRYDVLSDPS